MDIWISGPGSTLKILQSRDFSLNTIGFQLWGLGPMILKKNERLGSRMSTPLFLAGSMCWFLELYPGNMFRFSLSYWLSVIFHDYVSKKTEICTQISYSASTPTTLSRSFWVVFPTFQALATGCFRRRGPMAGCSVDPKRCTQRPCLGGWRVGPIIHVRTASSRSW